MSQYCRYCAFCISGDCYYCTNFDKVLNRVDRATNCKEFVLSELEEIGISPPITYKIFKHANCIGCLKAGRQHWYAVYCMRRDIFDEAKAVEEDIGHSIIKGAYLKELEPKFEDMLNNLHICCNEHTNAARFWADVENALPEQCSLLPCDCSF